MQHRSISQKLKRAKSVASKTATVEEWALYWQTEQTFLIEQLEQAINKDDYDALCRTTGQLKVVTLKRFIALSSVLKIIYDN